MNDLKLSDYVTLITVVPESHADKVREAIGKAGGGESGNYAFCSFSVKGIGRFMPKQGANPFQGEIGTLETCPEERIEAICAKDRLEKVIEAIKQAHPYEETVIDLYPIYEIGLKRSKH